MSRRDYTKPNPDFGEGLLYLYKFDTYSDEVRSVASEYTSEMLNGNWISDSYEIGAVGERISFGTDYWNNAVSGLGATTICIEFEFRTVTAATVTNVLTAFYNTASNAILIYLNATNGEINVGARSQNADSLQSIVSTKQIQAGVRYNLVAVFDYAGDAIRFYLNGEEWGNGAVTFGASTYTAGTGSEADCFGRTAAWSAEAAYYKAAFINKALPEAEAKALSLDLDGLYALKKKRHLTIVPAAAGGGGTLTSSVDVYIQKHLTLAATSDLHVQKPLVEIASADSVLQKAITVLSTADTQVTKAINILSSGDLHVETQGLTAQASSDLLLAKAIQVLSTSDVHLQSNVAITAVGDLYTQVQGLSVSASADLVLNALNSITASADMILASAGGGGIAQATADLYVQKVMSLLATADLLLERQGQVVTSSADAHLAKKLGVNASADMVAQKALSNTALADLYVQTQRSLTATVDLLVVLSDNLSAVADMVLEASLTATSSADLHLQGPVQATALADLVLLSAGASNITSITISLKARMATLSMKARSINIQKN